jgi:UDP-N-acetylglucosamine--N-acetylmuramyl-(pentapeptide) pyrophosphoryl-undecaprenol N-acetylglucosamine transferase
VTVPYLSNMELGYAAADLVLSRGGAMTLAEVTTVGLPAVYVPLPYGNGEQRRNALPIVQAGGGLLVDDADLTPEWISRTVVELARDRARLHEMGAAAARFGRRDGDEALRTFMLEAVADGVGRHRRSA